MQMQLILGGRQLTASQSRCHPTPPHPLPPPPPHGEEKKMHGESQKLVIPLCRPAYSDGARVPRDVLAAVLLVLLSWRQRPL